MVKEESKAADFGFVWYSGIGSKGTTRGFDRFYYKL